ncbi:antibiotic biosynthesis monooxygenase [Halolamina salifodinae]|uniref:Antibiotic biosynthesis monooxygenase (ABM) superfamily enzyme n=1 Tax=Halolamina salifodinae TaxID=1202767 RepID=A0A8T4GZK5_9EURY|nr:antibiotic biosynthesis monooxygenase [Halolamina salifodinae]MBP1986795.1 antibiotic biosynthesis monooxygenase (ABM) superfamily enzyme [Halolamina salifodinae]
MIVRVWHGWTAPEDADAYEAFLTDEADGLLATMSGEGYLGYDLLRRAAGDEVEFVTQIRFADYGAVAEFAGENYEEAHIPATARELLSRWEDEAVHYEQRASDRV